MQVVSLGEPLVELVAQEAGPLWEVAHFRRGWGGDTWNFAVGAARAGASVSYVTKVGADDFGSAFIRTARGLRIDTSHVIVDPERFTGLYLVAFDHDQNHSFTYFRTGSAASALSRDDIDARFVRGAQLIHTSGITQAISESARAAADTAISVARESGVLVSYDANLRPKLAPPEKLRHLFLSTIGRSDIVFLSEQDARIAFGTVSQEGVIETILGAGVASVVLKRGERGCVVATDRAAVALEGFPIERRDASGAGDAFAAAYVVELLNGSDPIVAATHANAAGALTAAGLGTVSAIPSREEVVGFLRRRSSHVSSTTTAGPGDSGGVYRA